MRWFLSFLLLYEAPEVPKRSTRWDFHCSHKTNLKVASKRPEIPRLSASPSCCKDLQASPPSLWALSKGKHYVFLRFCTMRPHLPAHRRPWLAPGSTMQLSTGCLGWESSVQLMIQGPLLLQESKTDISTAEAAAVPTQRPRPFSAAVQALEKSTWMRQLQAVEHEPACQPGFQQGMLKSKSEHYLNLSCSPSPVMLEDCNFPQNPDYDAGVLLDSIAFTNPLQVTLSERSRSVSGIFNNGEIRNDWGSDRPAAMM